MDYGQLPAKGEIQAASAVCAELGLSHRVLTIDCRSLGSGDLAGTPPVKAAPVPEWWPFRNQLLVTVAATLALKEELSSVVLGIVANDTSHADGRPEFLMQMDALLKCQEGSLALEYHRENEKAVRHSDPRNSARGIQQSPDTTTGSAAEVRIPAM
jgi:7-cyano-7-deazaguanine synthase